MPNQPREPETTLWKGRYSPKAMFGTWLATIVLSVAVLVGAAMIPGDPGPKKFLVGGILGVCWVWAIAIYMYRRLSVSYEFTTERLVHRQGILLQKTDRIELIDIDDVTFTQGIVQRLFKVGKITLIGNDSTHRVFEIIGVDDVESVSELIDSKRREERRRRAFHVEAI